MRSKGGGGGVSMHCLFISHISFEKCRSDSVFSSSVTSYVSAILPFLCVSRLQERAHLIQYGRRELL